MQDCSYTLETLCTKIFIQGCTNFVLEVNSKVLTATVEVYKCDGVKLHFRSKCGTLQIDMCKNVDVVFDEQAHFFDERAPSSEDDLEKKNTNMIVWCGRAWPGGAPPPSSAYHGLVSRAGCHNLNVSVTDTQHSFATTFDEMKKEFNDLVEERSQFRLKLARTVAGEVRFVQERVRRASSVAGLVFCDATHLVCCRGR